MNSLAKDLLIINFVVHNELLLLPCLGLLLRPLCLLSCTLCDQGGPEWVHQAVTQHLALLAAVGGGIVSAEEPGCDGCVNAFRVLKQPSFLTSCSISWLSRLIAVTSFSARPSRSHPTIHPNPLVTRVLT